jgi:hypothetical protein
MDGVIGGQPARHVAVVTGGEDAVRDHVVAVIQRMARRQVDKNADDDRGIAPNGGRFAVEVVILIGLGPPRGAAHRR